MVSVVTAAKRVPSSAVTVTWTLASGFPVTLSAIRPTSPSPASIRRAPGSPSRTSKAAMVKAGEAASSPLRTMRRSARQRSGVTSHIT